MCWEDCFALLQQLRAHFHFIKHCPTVLEEVGARNFGLPTVLRFARFRVIGISLALTGLQVRRETAQIAKCWPSFRSGLTRSRSFVYLRQPTDRAWPLDHRFQLMTPQTRDLGLKIRGVLYDARHTEHMPAVARLNVPLVARDQGAKCALSIGADRRKSATPRIAPASQLAHSRSGDMRKMVTGTVANFDRFLLFSASPE